MAAPPASADAPRSPPPPPPPPAAGDGPDRPADRSEPAREDGCGEVTAFAVSWPLADVRRQAGWVGALEGPGRAGREQGLVLRGALCFSNAESLDRLLPPVGARRSPRKRTTSQCKSEPPLLRTSKRTIYTAGRPPWYNEHGTQSKEAFAIGLGGGSASGKTTVARMIIEALDVPWVVLLSMDSFYKVLTTQQQEQAAHNNFNFDHPDAFDFDLIVSTLKKLKQGKSVKVPVYDFTTHSRKKDWKTLYGANVIIFEGIMAFADKTLLELLDMKIFVDTDSDIRLVRRLRRDISERGRDIEGVIKQYNKFVKPAFDQYIQPTMRVADIVVPWGSGNTVAIDLIVQHMHSQLEERKLRWDMAALASAHQCHPLPRTLSVLKSTPQVRGMHTIIRDKETSRDEFIFYSKRLMRLLIEHALSFLPFQDCVVQTPQGQDYAGKCYAGKQITGVSILRAGETMEPALRAVCKDVRIGTILIQTNQHTGEPELHYLRLPKDISDDHVILMDCTVSTGAAAMMAVRVLLVSGPRGAGRAAGGADRPPRRTTTCPRTRSSCCRCSWRRWASTRWPTRSRGCGSSPRPWTSASTTCSASSPASVTSGTATLGRTRRPTAATRRRRPPASSREPRPRPHDVLALAEKGVHAVTCSAADKVKFRKTSERG
ncbi:uridine-cytidine kinase-like 1 isoform X3 [Vulpes lagopus]|uniref:uridine-cytidine kinase-like 1 isoform X3 n=1 Tax=Vulpes lagopus TaxID=494514 RepID=UPI001BC90719|nr:uridine-cytidine kinase-like 1 isoform X3 [Vulpes lagopus]